MAITFDITVRDGQQALGRLRWPEHGLDSAAVSGPHGNGALPTGSYLAKNRGFSDRAGQAPYCDPGGDCWFQFIAPRFATPRTDLGVHPDGNVFGTLGCIGLLDADCRPWRQAFAALTGDIDLDVRDVPGLAEAAASPWPPDTQAALDGFYGVHVLGNTGKPTASWEKANLVTVAAPYRLTLSWDLSKTVTRLRCHRLVADSMGRILQAILDHYGSEAAVKKHRMHLFGGCYEYRKIGGSNRLSTHSWGVGIDLDPERNPRGKTWNPQDGMMPMEVVSIFEAEGWRWGGRFVSTPDAMHFQATS